jgi:beta-N-acetylglucosaminidase
VKDTSLASGGTSGGPTSSSSSPSQRNLKQTEIWLNGKLVSSPMAFAWNHTTYMPIWYVMEVLQRIGVTQPRPWDGTHWSMATKNGLFTAYKMDGTKLQDYATLSDAEAAVSNVPGADVKDGSGTVVHQVPDYRAFASPTKIVGDFTSVQTAASALQASNGYVINVKTNTVAQYPEDYYYLNNDGQWTSKKSGPTGTAAPSFAKLGETYYVVAASTTQYYLLSPADNQYSGKLLNPNSSENPLQNVDLRFPAPSSVTPAQIDNWLSQHQSPLTGLGASFVSAQNKYGVDATYLVSHAVLETYWGTSQIYKAKNNLYGWGAYDSNPGNYAGSFPSSDYAIQYEAYIVRQVYLEPGGTFYVSPTLDGMQKHYATDTSWANSIARIMNQYVSENNGTVSAYPQFPQSTLPPVSLISDEPVYRMNRATAKVLSNPCGNLPVFSDPGSGASQMFPGTLKYGSSGSAVKQLQKALGVTADGVFGRMTQSALTAYQRNHPGTAGCVTGLRGSAYFHRRRRCQWAPRWWWMP